MCYENKEWYKIWRVIAFSVQNWNDKFNIFWPKHSKISLSKKMPFNGLRLTKVGHIWAKKVQSSYLSWHWRMMQNWRGIDLSVQNLPEKFNKFWQKHLKISKMFLLMSWFWPKYVMLELKKYWRVIFHDTGELFRIWGGTDWSV